MNKIYESGNDRLLFLGEINYPTDYLFLSDYFILSSKYEGMPISLIESFACKCIPISTPVGGIPEMIDDDGFVSKSLSLDDFENSILKALNISEKEKQIILKNNFKKFEHFYSISSTW